MGVSAKLPPAEQVCREQLFPLDKPSEQQQLESVELPPQQEGKNRSEELPAAPTHCGGAAAAGNKDLFSSQPQPWTGSLPKPGSNHSRDSRLREGSSSPRFGKDGLCCASLELAEAQVWLVPSYLLTVKPEKKGGKILQLAVNLCPGPFMFLRNSARLEQPGPCLQSLSPFLPPAGAGICL